MKSQSLPMYAIVVIIIGLVVLAVFVLYAFGIFGSTKGLFSQWFSFGSSKSSAAQSAAGQMG